MARGFATALQAALAGVAGGASGYARYQEEERRRMREQQESEERQALNLASLYERGFKTPEQLAQDKEQQGMAGARLFSAMKGSAKLTDQDVNALSQAAATQGGPAGRVRYGGQDLVLPETDAGRSERLGLLGAERERLAKQQKADADRAAAAEKQRGISELLNQPRFRGMPQEYRAAVASGMMTLPQAIEASRPRGGAAAPSTQSRMREIEEAVAKFVAANTGKTRTIKDEDMNEIEVPFDVMGAAEQLRANLMRAYGMSDDRSIARAVGGGGSRGFAQGMYGSGGGASSPRTGSAAPSRPDTTSSRSSRDTTSSSRRARPLTFSFSSGRTYELPEE